MKVILAGGTEVSLGTIETAPTIGIIDYSRRVTDDFGVTTVVERGFSRRLSARLLVPFDEVDDLQRRLAGLRATPVQWVGDAGSTWLSPTGFFKEFEIDLATPPVSYCTLTVEGLAETETGADAGSDPAPVGLASTLAVLRPIEITDAVLSASNVPESDTPAWSATTTYPAGARVRVSGLHRVYESLVAGNVGANPSASVGRWLDVGPTNRWAMFDQALGTATTRDGSINVTLAAGDADSVAVLDVVGTRVRVRSGTYDQDQLVTGGTLVFTGLPGGESVLINIYGTAVSVGTLLIGTTLPLGATEAAPSAGITDFSRKAADEFGEVTVVQRAWAKRMSARALIRTDALDLVADRIASVRALPSLWIGSAGSDALTIYGFFKDFSIEVGETVSKLSLSVEGFSAAAKLGPLVSWPDVGDPDGTKPDDNATNGAPGGTPIGGVVQPDGSVVGARTAEEVVEELQVNTLGIIAQALRQDDFLEVVDARTLVEGQAVSVKFLAFRNQQIDDNAAFASDLSLIGVKTADGTGWNLALDTVRVSPEQTLGQHLTEIGVKTADAEASIQDLQEVLIDGDGTVTAKAVLALDVNGKVVGTIATNDGTLGVLDLLFDAVIIRNPVSGLPLFTADTAAGLVKATNLEVDHLKVNTAIVPARAAAGSEVVGPGSFVTILTATVDLPIAGWVEATASIRQSFSSGDEYWEYDLLIDGTVVFNTSGHRTQDSVPVSGAKLCSPGPRTVQVRFQADSSVSVFDRTLFVKGFPATE